MKSIKSISTYIQEINGESVKSEYLEYDEKENLILSVKFDDTGNIIEKTTFTYDDQKRKLTETNYISDTEIAESSKFVYNAEGELEQIETEYAEGYSSIRKFEKDDEKKQKIELELDGDEIEEKHIRQYDENGNLIEKASYDDRGKLISKTCYTYDEKGRMTEEAEYEKKGKKPIQKRIFAYEDEKDKFHYMKILNHKGKIINQYQLSYDESGRVISQTSPVSGKIEIDYKSDRDRVERSLDAAGNVQNETRFLFDENANLIKEESELFSKIYEINYFGE